MKFSSVGVVAFQALNDLRVAIFSRTAQPREERLFFVCRVAFAPGVKILQCGLHGRPFFFGKASIARTLRDQAEDVKEALNSPVAILQHANRIIKATIWFCTYLNGHLSPLLNSSRRSQRQMP